MDAITTQVLPKEYSLSRSKVIRRDTRAAGLNGYGATVGGMAVTNQFFSKLVPVVASQLATGSRGGTEYHQFEVMMRRLTPEVISLAIIQGALHSIGNEDDLRGTYAGIGRLLERECFAAKLLRHDRKRGEKLIEEARKDRASVGGRVAALRKAAARAGVTKKGVAYTGFEVERWDAVALVYAGSWCVSRLLEALPNAFEVTSRTATTKTPAGKIKHETTGMLVLTEEALTTADSALRAAIMNHPVYGPRLTPPADWDGFMARPSEDARVSFEVPLLRTRHNDIKAATKRAIKDGQAAPALKGLNTLQSVPFKINTWVLDLIEECRRQGIEVPGLPMLSPLQRNLLSQEDYNALSVEERELHSRETKAARKLNLARIGETVSFEEDMTTARELAKAPAFYVPTNMDWRGRVYGITFFNFQREDRVRSLFLFANGKPVTERGIYWLKVHVANCWAQKGEDGVGIDKKPLDQRVAWVDAHLDQITDVVLWPTGRAYQWWRDADSPFLFLAACRELVNAIEHGVDYVCHMPVSFDGSCSGIQHLACMTRAEEGQFVNLTDNETPEDIYQRVADKMKLVIEQDRDRNVEELQGEEFTKAEKARRYAKLALDYGVNRKLVKRNTMTFAYSSKVFGMSDQQLKDTMEPLQVEVLKGLRKDHPFGDESTQYGAAKYLGRHAYNTIVDIVRKPAEAMGFLQKLAQALAHEGKPLRWVTPAGLPWINRYHEPHVEKITLTLTDNGVKTRRDVAVSTGVKPGIDKAAASNAVAPNFVHALDASHLLLTVGASADAGITDIATVHDSFGCLPSDGDLFNEIIRATLVRMYTEHDVLAEVYASARADLDNPNPDTFPLAPPEKGELNLEEIKNAKYAFA